MPTWLAVAFGGAGGAVLRWLLCVRFNTGLPWGTLLVNVIGSFAIGLLFVVLDGRGLGEPIRAGIIVGLLGGFTTFSAFSLEAMHLIERGAMKMALLYVVSSLIICIVAAFAGMAIARNL